MISLCTFDLFLSDPISYITYMVTKYQVTLDLCDIKPTIVDLLKPNKP